MRSRERIEPFLKEIGRIWGEHALDWRFGQFIINVLGACERDPWFYEEDEMLEHFKKYFGEIEEKKEEENEQDVEL